jgi:uncharacterized protein with ATP-grasp and redox domains
VIDSGINNGLDEATVEAAIQHALSAPLHGDPAALQTAVGQARDILYLADNAGEIVFDRLLVEQMPPGSVTVAVRGRPVLNDATMEDAEAAGLTQRVRVTDNGSDAPGTLLEDCSGAFRRLFERADLVVAKGQGNYETLSDVDKSIFFVLKAKCPVIARHIGCQVGDLVIQKKLPILPGRQA